MTQVVEQDFELQRVPQARPGATKHAIDKLPPQFAKGRFDLLPHLTEDKAMRRGLSAGNKQHVGFFRQLGSTGVAPLAQITKSYSSIDALDQRQRRAAVIPIARGQENIEHPSVHMAQQMQFEAKEPAFARFAKVCPVLPQQSDSPMPNGQTQGNGFTIYQIQLRGVPSLGTRRGQQLPNVRPEMVNPREPLLVRTQRRKGRPPVLGDQSIGLFEGGDCQDALQQRNRQHFGITEARLGMG
jgi:hypothetical protein